MHTNSNIHFYLVRACTCENCKEHVNTHVNTYHMHGVFADREAKGQKEKKEMRRPSVPFLWMCTLTMLLLKQSQISSEPETRRLRSGLAVLVESSDWRLQVRVQDSRTAWSSAGAPAISPLTSIMRYLAQTRTKRLLRTCPMKGW